jgi:hypothetical protein
VTSAGSAIFSQFGFDIEKWPAGLREDYERFAAARGATATANTGATA